MKRAMPQNLLIALPEFTLPSDFPWRVRFIAAVDDQLRCLRASGRFLPPRFFGYYFQCGHPVGVTGRWTVTLDAVPALTTLPGAIQRATEGHCSIASDSGEIEPDFLLVHDRCECACWLWRFSDGLRFVEATDPVSGDDDRAPGDGEDPKLLGP